MPSLDLTDEERAALADYLRRKLAEERYPMAPALRPVKAVCERLRPKPEPLPPPMPFERPSAVLRKKRRSR